MDFSELHQYFNDFSSAIRKIADKTGNAVYDVKVEISNLVAVIIFSSLLLLTILGLGF